MSHINHSSQYSHRVAWVPPTFFFTARRKTKHQKPDNNARPSKKMTTSIPFLKDLKWRGFRSGLRFETKGTTVVQMGHYEHTHRFLLHFPGCFQVARALVTDLGSTNKIFINRVLADFFYYAAKHVHLCENLSPVEFFTLVKDSQEWAAKMDAVLRRETTQHGTHQAIDQFHNAFIGRYDPQTLPEGMNRRKEEYWNFCCAKYAEYFKFCSPDCEGDGEDRPYRSRLLHLSHDPVDDQYRPVPPNPAREQEVGIGFYYDVGKGKPTYGHTDLSRVEPQQDDAQATK
ncbi:hypothetical protein F5Y17DRAFT_476040 [Xylariaceae sp. FL0594]|nr:hypothetical protein F5Y17DRAFT_476040 [Xylariaceae sp. FL0594]